MASFAPAHETDGVEDKGIEEKTPYKSFKKKFLKLRHTFRDRMRESNSLYDDEIHAKQIARRLQEQNDQILELLLEINDSRKLAPHTRYDLSSPPPSLTDIPDLISEQEDGSPSSPHEEVHDAQLALREARLEYERGDLDRSSFQATEASLLRVMAEGRKLSNLHCTVHTRPDNGEGVERTKELYPDLWEEGAVGYLSPTHAEGFLSQYDAFLESAGGLDGTSVTVPYVPGTTARRASERERERDGMLHNPMSVYNWLSTHRPKELAAAGVAVAAEEEEAAVKASATGGSGVGAKSSSRRSPPKGGPAGSASGGGKVSKRGGGGLKDEEMLDDEGFVVGGEGGADEGGIAGAGAGGKKRKRGTVGEDDGSYRPKGGSSKKRKRASTKGGEGGG